MSYDPTSFAALEAGRQTRPAELYEFLYGEDRYRYTSANDAIVFDSQTYAALEIKRNQPTLNPLERRSTKIQVEVPFDLDFVQTFQGVLPNKRLEVTISRVQLDENPTLAGQSPEPAPAVTTAFVVFQGYCNSVAFSGKVAKMDFNPFNEKLTREIPRMKYQSLCNHVLYDSRCSVNKASFQQSGLCSGQVSNVYTIDGFSGNAFTGGYIVNEAGDDYRAVLNHDGDQFTVLIPFRDTIVGETVTVQQGCDHTLETCRDKFSNVANFGGYPYIPEKNPFNQSQFTKS